MKLTRKSEYAARAMVEIALNDHGSHIGVAKIARRQGIPRRFLEQILADLRRAGFLESHRGAHGGYCFAIPSREVTILDIIEVMDGDVRRYVCSSRNSPVSTCMVWEEAQLALENAFARYSIARLAETEREMRNSHGSASGVNV